MNIRRKIGISFMVVIILIIFIAYFNNIISQQIIEHHKSLEKIKTLAVIQKNMNKLALESRYVNSKYDLMNIKNEFLKEEKNFEKIKKYFSNRIEDEFIDKFIKELQEYPIIENNLHKLYDNEKKIEKSFDKLYELQIRKIMLINLFSEKYKNEKEIRNKIEIDLEVSKDISIIKIFAQIKYYGKEALYQKRTQKYLNKWLNSTIRLDKELNNSLIKDYIVVVKILKNNILETNTINNEEQSLVKQIQNIITNNSKISKNIIFDSSIIVQDAISYMNYILLAILLLTISIIIFISYKVSQNIGLSVDEIEHKVEDGIKEIKNLSKEIENTQKEVVFTMGAIGESRSKETGNHVKRVAEYSKLLALYYGLDEKDAEMLKQASPMHDIGKVAIPDAILNKPGRFDDDERKIMDTHAKLGYDMLKVSSRPLLQTAAIVAYEHHEKYNGTGYPRGLKGEDIHIFGRITALADVFDALGSDRCYKKAWDDEKIFKLFKEERAKHFDPKLIDIFFDNLDEFLKIRENFKEDI